MPYTFRKNDIPFFDLDIDRGNAFTSWKEGWDAYALGCYIFSRFLISNLPKQLLE